MASLIWLIARDWIAAYRKYYEATALTNRCVPCVRPKTEVLMKKSNNIGTIGRPLDSLFAGRVPFRVRLPIACTAADAALDSLAVATVRECTPTFGAPN
jgi:hypothetical protein